MKFRTPYDDDYIDPGYQKTDKEGRPVDIDGNPEPSLTVQDQLEECDINLIVKKHEATGILPVMNLPPVFGDFSDVKSYQDALQIVIEADKTFSALPADVRKRFGNDPAQFLDFVDDPKNADELVKMGLRTPQSDSSEKTTSTASGGEKASKDAS